MGIAAMDILCCRITIGDADPSNPMRIQNGVEITEVQSLEINESYKKLIGTAKVIFPKASVCDIQGRTAHQYQAGLQRRAEKYVRRIHYRIQFGQHAGNPV